MTRSRLLVPALACLVLAACGSDSSSGEAAGGTAGSAGAAGAAGGTAGSSTGGTAGAAAGGAAAGGAAAGGTAGAAAGGASAGGSGGAAAGGSGGPAGGSSGASGQSGASGSTGQPGARFRYGMNGGFFTSKVADADTAALGVAVGVNSQRCKLTEQHLTTWGDEIEVGDMKAYEALGMRDLVAFLGGPIAAHSSAPAGKADWELEYYSPRNLYEPIWLPGGEVNPDNYWAAFVARVAKTYGPYLRTYEVWNEPDQVGGNWQATLDWDKSPPKPSDLVWWNDTIFAYVRALRIAHEVIHKYDPDGQVALGGVGYPSFLGAILRYSDEPTKGEVGGDYPSAGGAYFDVLSFHYYPVFSPGNSDAGAAGLLEAKADLQARLDAAGVSGKSWMVTESGAPRYAFGNAPGGEAYARNYLLKIMTLGHDADLGGIDWFVLGDGKKPGQSEDPFAYMGLYLNYSDVQGKDEAVKTPTGVAYATLGQVLGGGTNDKAATAALALPGSVGGAAFRTADGRRAYALWARSGAGEDAQATYELASDKPVETFAWDASQTKQSATVEPSGGKVSLALTSSPLLVVVP